MAYTAAEGRQELLDSVAAAAQRLAFALTALGSAYEQLDEFHADDLEEQLFRPVQRAYGQAQRIHAEFAARHDHAGGVFAAPSAGLPSRGPKLLIEDAVEAVAAADAALGELQDSMLPVEVGDAELRAQLAQLRESMGGLRARAREVVRTLGR